MQKNNGAPPINGQHIYVGNFKHKKRDYLNK
jgi:hypothetical protein